MSLKYEPASVPTTQRFSGFEAEGVGVDGGEGEGGRELVQEGGGRTELRRQGERLHRLGFGIWGDRQRFESKTVLFWV